MADEDVVGQQGETEAAAGSGQGEVDGNRGRNPGEPSSVSAIVGNEKPAKGRGGRRKAGTANSLPSEQSQEATTPKKRGRRKLGETDTKAQSGSASRQRKTAEPAPLAQVEPIAALAASDHFEDLLQLEQENQRLRQLLAAKLREENAELRKRLGLG